MMTESKFLSRAKQSGHTLVEVLIASSVSLMVVTGALWVMFAGVKTSAQSTNTVINDLTQWGIASRLWIDSRIANGITIYADTEVANVERWLRAVVNDRGNFVVFSLSDTNGSGKTFYTRLSGYVFDPSQRKVFRFDYPVKASDQSGATPLEDILNNNRTAIIATYVTVASSVDAIDSSGVFLCRTAGTAASFGCKVTSGDTTRDTFKEKVVEATFYVRS
ncbi:MAG: prepilin-type N-terminal cleavage/methylation domain-containing protein [Opitutaceae bacterium]|jgi:hypothetical protein|nr:prepilin-type N-terminal cleavage/methylation domain-containing protein [Opitutaceae bacterium]